MSRRDIIREYAREMAVIRSLFSAQNEEISLRRRAPRGPAGGAESAPPEPVAGLNFPEVMPTPRG